MAGEITLVDGKESHDYVLKADLNSVVTLRDLWFLYSFLLSFQLSCCHLFYPTKILRKILSECLSGRLQIYLNTFMEKFHFCYRDGLGGTKDMRNFSGINFLLRIIIYSIESFCWTTLDWDQCFTRGFIFSIATLLANCFKSTL